MVNRDTVLVEFAVQVFVDGRIDWGGTDELLWWILHRKTPGGFEANADKIARFGIVRAANGRSPVTFKRKRNRPKP